MLWGTFGRPHHLRWSDQLAATIRAVKDILEAELDRVGVSYRKAGAKYVRLFVDMDGGVHLFEASPSRRKSWHGPFADAIARLAGVADDAGPDGLWQAFS